MRSCIINLQRNLRLLCDLKKECVRYYWSTKPEGDISSVFASLSGDEINKPLDDRFRILKEDIIHGYENQIEKSWIRLLDALKTEIANIRRQGSTIIPQFDWQQIHRLSSNQLDSIRQCGVMVVRGVLPENDALELKRQTREYIRTNPHSKGFPSDRPVVYELYWSPAQVAARSNRNVVETLNFANSLWKSSETSEAIWEENLVYADRLRIRQPGDQQFSLGPHVDGGSIERWEDLNYRSVYRAALEGRWEELDLFDGTHRILANMSIYNTVGGCSIFRSWQGWLSLSNVKPGQGGLQVNPMLRCATAYWMLRPFFKNIDRNDLQWSIDRSSLWPGAIPGRGQEINNTLHPHLELDHSMVSIPEVRPGDMVLWHCDTIHSVDSIHRGSMDSSVFYIPAVPLCHLNIDYLRRQRDAFEHGYPPPDFPGGQGELKHIGRTTVEQLKQFGGAKGMGFEHFHVKSHYSGCQERMISAINARLH